MRKSRFLWSHFFTHPGTWVGLALFIIGIGILFSFMVPTILPAIAPTLLLVAGVSTLFALVSFPFYVARYLDRLSAERDDIIQKSGGKYATSSPYLLSVMLEHFGNWVTNYPFQALFVSAGIIAFALALWLTVSFFTGGSTLLMAPVFAAIAAPFIANSTIGFAGLPLALAITSGVIFSIAPLFLTNVVKRLLAVFSSSTDEPKITDVEYHMGEKRADRHPSESLITEDGSMLPYLSQSVFYRITHSSVRIYPDEPKVSEEPTKPTNNPFY